MDTLHRWLGEANGVLWGSVLVYLLLGAGLFFTIRTRGIQVRLFKRGIREMAAGFTHRSPGDISPFQAFATGLASRLGVGNIAGVAIAISLGGPGAVFWMWMTALLGMASTVVECTLAQVYKQRHPDGTFRGGPAYYIAKGLGRPWLALIFAFSLLIAFGFVFNAIQCNAVATVMQEAYGVSPSIVGIVLVLVTAVVICGGIREVGVVSEFMVPIMGGFYLILTLVVVCRNWTEIPGVFADIFKGAFGFGPAAAGFAGYSLVQALSIGVCRGLFTNEACMGSAPNAAASATTDHPATQGLLQMFGVFLDTMIGCSCTAFMILLSDAFVPGQAVEGVRLTQVALSGELGLWSKHFLAVSIFFFAFASVIGNYAYAEGNIDYLGKPGKLIWIFRVLVLAMVYFGAIAKVDLVWQLGDLSQAFMVVINLFAILSLSGIAFAVLRDYEAQLRAGVARPRFSLRRIPPVKGTMPGDVW